MNIENNPDIRYPDLHHSDFTSQGAEDSLENSGLFSRKEHGVVPGSNEVERIYGLGKPGLVANSRPFGAFIRLNDTV